MTREQIEAYFAEHPDKLEAVITTYARLAEEIGKAIAPVYRAFTEVAEQLLADPEFVASLLKEDADTPAIVE